MEFDNGDRPFQGTQVENQDTSQEVEGVFTNTSFRRDTFVGYGTQYYLYDSAVTFEHETYADYEAWIIIVQEYEFDYNTTTTAEPYTATANQPFFPYWDRVTARIAGFSEDYVLDEQWITDFSQYTEIEVIECEIYDFHGTPVYIFTWMDWQREQVRYVMAFDDEYFESEYFDVTNLYTDFHDVYDSYTDRDAAGRGWARAAGMKKQIIKQI